MTETTISNINETYFKLLSQQQFVENDLDYSNFNKHLPSLKALADISNTGISVYDLFKKEHIF